MINFLNLKESVNFFFIFISIVLFFFCLFLYFSNKKLKQQIIKLEKEAKETLERKIMKEKEEDLVSIQTISKEKTPQREQIKPEREQKLTSNFKSEYIPTMPKRAPQEVNMSKKNISFTPKMNSTPLPNSIKKRAEKVYKSQTNTLSKEEKILVNQKEKPNQSKIIPSLEKTSLKSKELQVNSNINTANKAPRPLKESSAKKTDIEKKYQKNLFQTNNKVTSPVSITNQETFNMNQLSFDLNEFIKRSEKVVPKIEEKKSHPDYLKEISSQLENALEPDPIELTDYEKEQEEHAIISYQELLSLKDNIQMKDDEEETIDFIEELKNFRNTLH